MLIINIYTFYYLQENAYIYCFFIQKGHQNKRNITYK